MLFNSWVFLLGFLPITLSVFLVIPASQLTARKVWLILASFFFYGWWKVEYVPLLLFSMVLNYSVASLIHRWRGQPLARVALVTGVTVNLLMLGYFKYTNFLLSVVGLAMHRPVPVLDIALPLAISFFTFTQIGFIVDVSRDPDLHYSFLDYLLFVVFFPHLIAGPIVRHWEVIPQFSSRALRASMNDLAVGSAFFLLGLYKKVLLADGAAAYANSIYGAAGGGVTLPWFDAWLGTVAYALQIYFDFSGYSDMAIGLARLFAIKFPCNFDSPYRADSIGEFWRRWHMSLTRFLRDYVYIPLGGNRRGPARQIGNILFTFLLSGLWHGAGWTFVMWGVLHGAMLAAQTGWRKLTGALGWQPRHWLYRGACVLLTFGLVQVAWVFFRSPDVSTAGSVLQSMVGAHGWTLSVETTNPKREIGQLLQAVGFQFVPDVAGLKSYTDALWLVCLLMAVVWCLPNTQQMLAKYDPALEDHLRPARLHLRLNAATGLAIGMAFFLVIRSHFGTVASPFLYFNF
jgi:alginate O-acetyltransferase complex protein AlgI